MRGLLWRCPSRRPCVTRPVDGETIERQFHKLFCFRAWNEHARADEQVDAMEIDVAHDVLERLAVDAALDTPVKLRLEMRREIRPRGAGDGDRIVAKQLRDEPAGLLAGVFHAAFLEAAAGF